MLISVKQHEIGISLKRCRNWKQYRVAKQNLEEKHSWKLYYNVPWSPSYAIQGSVKIKVQ